MLAAKQNFPEALYTLGQVYLDGVYVTENFEEAIYCLCLAAKQNYELANDRLKILIREAVTKNDIKNVILLIYNNIHINKDELITIATNNNSFEIVQMLLNRGLNINVTDEKGYTPLCIVADKENVKIVKLLIEHKADVSIKTNSGKTALMIAVFKKNVEIRNLILEEIRKKNQVNVKTKELITCIYTKNVSKVKECLNNGARINDTWLNWTPLIWGDFEKRHYNG